MTAPKQGHTPCAKRIYTSPWGSSQCKRAGVVSDGGKLWCKQHAPSLVSARRAERDQAMRAKWKADDARRDAQLAERAEEKRRAECHDALLSALREALFVVEQANANDTAAMIRAAIALATGDRPARCESCNGSGTRYPGHTDPCAFCGGTGEVTP